MHTADPSSQNHRKNHESSLTTRVLFKSLFCAHLSVARNAKKQLLAKSALVEFKNGVSHLYLRFRIELEKRLSRFTLRLLPPRWLLLSLLLSLSRSSLQHWVPLGSCMRGKIAEIEGMSSSCIMAVLPFESYRLEQAGSDYGHHYLSLSVGFLAGCVYVSNQSSGRARIQDRRSMSHGWRRHYSLLVRDKSYQCSTALLLFFSRSHNSQLTQASFWRQLIKFKLAKKKLYRCLTVISG